MPSSRRTALFLVAMLASKVGGAQLQHVETSLTTAPKGFASVEGRVLLNDHGCRHDLACYLRLDWHGQEVRIYYHQGEFPPCINPDVVTRGSGVAPGDRIRAYGLYRRARDGHVIDVCTAPGAVLEIRTAG